MFTSTSGGPTSAAIRSTTFRAESGSIGSAASRRMPSGSSLSPSSLRSTPTTVNPAAASFSAVVAAELTARADCDRHTLAHAATSGKTDVMVSLLPVQGVFSFAAGKATRHHRIPVICLSLGGDAFCAGEMRRKELAGASTATASSRTG